MRRTITVILEIDNQADPLAAFFYGAQENVREALREGHVVVDFIEDAPRDVRDADGED